MQEKKITKPKDGSPSIPQRFEQSKVGRWLTKRLGPRDYRVEGSGYIEKAVRDYVRKKRAAKRGTAR